MPDPSQGGVSNPTCADTWVASSRTLVAAFTRVNDRWFLRRCLSLPFDSRASTSSASEGSLDGLLMLSSSLTVVATAVHMHKQSVKHSAEVSSTLVLNTTTGQLVANLADEEEPTWPSQTHGSPSRLREASIVCEES